MFIAVLADRSVKQAMCTGFRETQMWAPLQSKLLQNVVRIHRGLGAVSREFAWMKA